MKIDKIIGDHLAGKGFAYSDNMWADMEILIKQNRREKMRKRLPYLFIPAIVIFIGLSIFSGNDNNKLQVNTKNTTVSAKMNSEAKHTPTLHQNAIPQADIGPFAIQENNKIHTHSNLIYSGQNQADLNTTKSELSDFIAPSIATSVVPYFESKEPQKQELLNSAVTLIEEINSKADTTLAEIEVVIPASDEKSAKQPDSVANSDTKTKYPRPHLPWIKYIEATIAYNSKFNVSSNKTLNAGMMQEKPGNVRSAALGFTLNKGIYSLGTGFQFTEFASSNSYAVNVTDWKYQYSFKLLNPNYKTSNSGHSIALIQKVKDSTGTARTVSLYRNTPSYLQYISIPLNAGLQKNFGRVFCRAEAGLSASFLVGKGGYYSVADEKGKTTIVNLSEYNKLKSAVFSNQFTFSLGYQINKHWMLLAKTSLNQTHGSLFSTFHETLNYTLFHFGLGGRF